MHFTRPTILWVALSLAIRASACQLVTAEEAKVENKEVAAAATSAKPDPGHSLHGEAFDEGPRQQARQMVGMGNVHLPITTDVPLVQELFDQGLGQLHGFWYFEAERSFRQAAMLDPDCPMLYWGMAMSNFENQKRAKGFIEQAVKHKAQAGAVEAQWIDGLDAYIRNPSKSDNKTRWKNLIKSYEGILAAEPKNIEARALLVWAIWRASSNDVPIVSHEAVDALLQQVLAAEPMHPGAHHYMIHLWDKEKPARALKSASLGGQSGPGIAHLWHMPGHTFSNLHRYADAVWQQEAAIRVDHAYMQRDRVLPYQIHNYAHNHEWLIRNFCSLGRVRDAMKLANDMLDLPRHPELNNLTMSGSCAAYGRQRLIETLTRFELWDELLAADQSGRLELTSAFDDQVKRLRLLGRAHLGRGDLERGKEQIAALETLLAPEAEPTSPTTPPASEPATTAGATAAPVPSAPAEAKGTEAAPAAETQAENVEPAAKPAEIPPAPAEPAAPAAGAPSNEEAAQSKAAENAKKERERRRKRIEPALAELRCYLALAEDRAADALAELKKTDGLSKIEKALVHRAAKDLATAEQLAREAFEADPQQVPPLAVYVDVLASAGKADEAAAQFENLRKLSAAVDLDVPPMRRVSAWAESRGLSGDWRTPYVAPDDVGQRPPLESLGPLTWTPTAAATWSLPDEAGNEVSLGQFTGKPVVVIFYLGVGCLHCVEQLQSFAPLAKDFRAAGIELVGISTDSREVLAKSLDTFRQSDGSAFPFPLLSNPLLDVFKSYRAHDDFENLPLHGTFLIDGQGIVRWHEISFQPFKQPKFLLDEAQRLLRQPRE